MKVGVFDSGLGGLTVVKEILSVLPEAELFYIADTAHAPYGDKTNEQIKRYAYRITRYFIDTHAIDALVVACNSATTAAIAYLRAQFPELVIVGTEPGIKPAVAATRSGKVGVLATAATLRSEKYKELAEKTAGKRAIEIYEQACSGLAEAIESEETLSVRTESMLRKWLRPMRDAGVDTLVLGCTHYPVIADEIKRIYGRDVMLIETGEAIAKRLKTLLYTSSVSRSHTVRNKALHLYATGKISRKSAERILHDSVDFEPLSL